MDFTGAAIECLQFVRGMIEKYGPRLAGTKACQESAAEIRDRLSESCDEVFLEGFDFHSGAFIGFMKFLAVGYAIMTLCAFIGGYWLIPAMIVYVLCCFSAIGEFVFYKEIFDPFYKKSRGWNVSGVILPSGEITRQVIIVGHHDSANEFNFMVHLQKWYSIRILAGLIGVFGLGFMVFLRGVFFIAGYSDSLYAPYLSTALAVGLIVVLPFYFFISKAVVPGAGDNLIATAILWRIAGIFGSAKKEGMPLLNSTKLIVLSTDAEEEGLRGARAYVKQNKNELLHTPTSVLNIDSLYTLRELKCLTSEINGFMKTSRDLAEKCRHIAGQLGYALTTAPIAFGGGATDAAEFARIGIDSTCILGLSTHYIREGMVYHTMDDTVDKIEPGIVEAVLKIVYEFILQEDAASDRPHPAGESYRR
jgi:aminopeptidase YwaD